MDCKHRAMAKSRLAVRGQRGLTLIELLIAISVLAFVAVLGWRGLDTIVRTRTALNEDLAQTRGLQLAFAQMQTDSANVASTFLLPDRLPIDIAPNRLTMIRTTGGDGRPTYLQVINYRVQDGVLSRREYQPTRDLNEVQQIWQTALNDFNTGNAVVLQTEVVSMAMRVWDGQGWRTSIAAPNQPAGGGRPSAKGQIMQQALSASPAGRPTGLEVALQVQQRESTMLKVFLLGVL